MKIYKHELNGETTVIERETIIDGFEINIDVFADNTQMCIQNNKFALEIISTDKYEFHAHLINKKNCETVKIWNSPIIYDFDEDNNDYINELNKQYFNEFMNELSDYLFKLI